MVFGISVRNVKFTSRRILSHMSPAKWSQLDIPILYLKHAFEMNFAFHVLQFLYFLCGSFSPHLSVDLVVEILHANLL